MTTGARLAQAVGLFQRGQRAKAIEQLSQLASEDGTAVVWNALGSLLGASGELTRARVAFARAVELRPDYSEANANLASVLLEQGALGLASEAFHVALGGKAELAATVGLARISALLGRHEQARRLLERAARDPRATAKIRSQRCYSALLDPALDLAEVVAIHHEYAAALPICAHRSRLGTPAPKTRIGYVSADFREHSVAYFIEGVLAAHDRDSVELIAYSDVVVEDATTARLRAAFDQFHCVASLSDAALADLIQSHAIRVLVDLAGHMQPNRLPVFAARPAPHAITYLGYPGTTGLTVFDGRLTDQWADPSDDRALAGPEPIVRVPGGPFAFTPSAAAPTVAPLPARAAGHVTFGSMNDALKTNDGVLALWSVLLRSLPSSRLLLKSRASIRPRSPSACAIRCTATASIRHGSTYSLAARPLEST